MSKSKGGTYRTGRRAPFAMMPVALLDDPKVDPQAIATYAALQSYCDYGSEQGAFVSDTKAAKRAHVGVRTFISRRSLLRDLGWVDWDSGKDQGRTNTYRVHQVGCARDAEGGVHEVHTPSARDAYPHSLYTESHIPESSSVGLPAIRRGGPSVPYRDVVGHLKEYEDETATRLKAQEWESLAVMAVFAYWVAMTGKDNARVRLSQDRMAMLRARLREGAGGEPDPVSCLMYAVDGALRDHRLVQEDKGIEYLEIDNIFRNWSRVERCAHHCPGYVAGKPHRMVVAHVYLQR